MGYAVQTWDEKLRQWRWTYLPSKSQKAAIGRFKREHSKGKTRLIETTGTAANISRKRIVRTNVRVFKKFPAYKVHKKKKKRPPRNIFSGFDLSKELDL